MTDDPFTQADMTTVTEQAASEKGVIKEPITDENIAEELDLAKKATPRPWWRGVHRSENIEDVRKFLTDAVNFYPENLTLHMLVSGPYPEDGFMNQDTEFALPVITGNGPTSEANMDFVCQAVNNYESALVYIQRLRAANKEMLRQLTVATELGEKRWFALNEIFCHGEKHNANWCKRIAQEALGIREENHA